MVTNRTGLLQVFGEDFFFFGGFWWCLMVVGLFWGENFVFFFFFGEEGDLGGNGRRGFDGWRYR